jgi:ATP-dependent RNA helicase HelY
MLKHRAIEESRQRLLQGLGVPEKGTFVVDDFQKSAIDNLDNGIDTLVVAPTGSGKTFIAVQAMKNLLKKGQRAVYTTPLKALSNTKYSEFQVTFGQEYSVGLLTGDRKIEGDSDVVIATTEIYRNELYSGLGRYSLVVLDEVHYIADPQRGAVWEESIILTPSSSTLLMLSASISNAEEIASWIEEVRNKECRIVVKKDRPVELRYAFLHPRYGVIPLSDEKGHLSPEVSHYYNTMSLDDGGGRGGFRRGGFRGGRGGDGAGGGGGGGGERGSGSSSSRRSGRSSGRSSRGGRR